jgi:hypothetical protein
VRTRGAYHPGPLFRPVVKLGRPRTLVRRHLLRVLKGTAIGEIGGDPGRAKRVASDRRGERASARRM